MLKTLVGGTTPIFTTVWNTANAGTSTSTQIKWPTVSAGTYNCKVYWGDGNSSTITTFNDAAWTHTYASSGIYTVQIAGTFSGLSFANGGDRLKLLQVGRWGSFRFGTVGSAFQGCSNLTVTATDIPVIGADSLGSAFRTCTSLVSIPKLNSWDVSGVTDFDNMFNGATVFNQNIGGWNVSSGTTFSGMFNTATVFNQNISSWNVSNGTTFSSMFVSNTAFNQNIGSWNVSKSTSFNNMFNGATAFNQNIGSWNVTAATGFSNMFSGVTLSNANYNLLLNGWSLQVVQTGRTFSGGNSHYDTTSGGVNGVTSRAVLTTTYTWTISDGGTP